MSKTGTDMPPLRVALFSGNYNYVMDGPARALNRLVGHLEQRNVSVMVFAPTAKTAALEHTGTLVSVPSISLPFRSEYRLGLGITPSVKAQLKDFRPTLFHLAAPDLLGYAALRLAKRWQIPVVASFHTRFDAYGRYYGGASLEKYATRYLLHFYNQCAQVYPPSESMAEELRAVGLTSDMRIWSRGVDCQMFSPRHRDMDWRRENKIADGTPVILFAGRLVREKGLGFFTQVINRLERAGVDHKVFIAGAGPERARLQKALPRALFAGHLRDRELARAYASADIFFNPSISETFGQVTLEAMASGLPAVCADATGSRSLVQHNKTGFLAPFGNHDAFANALCTLIEEPDLRARFGDEAVRIAKQKDWHSILDGLLHNYHDTRAPGALPVSA